MTATTNWKKKKYCTQKMAIIQSVSQKSVPVAEWDSQYCIYSNLLQGYAVSNFNITLVC